MVGIDVMVSSVLPPVLWMLSFRLQETIFHFEMPKFVFCAFYKLMSHPHMLAINAHIVTTNIAIKDPELPWTERWVANKFDKKDMKDMFPVQD